MSKFLSAAFLSALLLASAVSLSACNTVAGAGQDVSAAGHGVTNTAVSVKHDISK